MGEVKVKRNSWRVFHLLTAKLPLWVILWEKAGGNVGADALMADNMHHLCSPCLIGYKGV